MDLIGFLREKKSELNSEEHPFAYTDSTFKYIYCFGLGVLSYGNMKAINETKVYFDLILNNIRLHQNDKNRIIIDINNNFDYKINSVFDALDTKEKQYTFATDLFMLSGNTLWSQSYCEQVRDIYLNIFKFTHYEKDFFEQFCNKAKKKEIDNARLIYEEFMKNGYTVSYQLLKYMYPDFLLEEKFGDILLENGEQLIIDKPTKIVGNIIVKNGASLLIKSEKVKIEGSIRVDEGRIEIKKSNIQVLSCKNMSFLEISNSALVIIEDSIIDCNFNCGLLKQQDGYLVINHSQLLHTKNEYAILFSGKHLQVNGTTMEDCLGGGIKVIEEAILNIDDCEFYNCVSQHGGGIYSDSLYEASITNTKFKNCKAKYIGGAIYFAYKKYGQDVYYCQFIDCLPEASNTFNCYKEMYNNVT